MPTIGRLIVDIAANTSQLKTDLTAARGELSSFRSTVESGMGAIGRLGSMLGRLRGPAAIFSTLVVTAKALAEPFAEAERIGLRLEAVLKATGNTAGLSARQIKAMADELERTSFFDDEEIQRASALLATFGNISGRTFRDAIRLSIDLSSVFEGDLRSSTLALGKALDQPAEGLAALSRIGIRFTAEQKATIEAMVRMNDMAGAQQSIFRALEDRVGGAAGAEASGLAGSFKRLKDRIDDARKSLGGFLFGGQGVGLGDVIEQALRPKQQVQPGLQELPEQTFTGQTEGTTKEIGGLTTLATLKRVTAADISRLRELGRTHAEAIRLPRQELESYVQFLDRRVRLARELKQIQEALQSLERPRLGFGHNLGAMLDQARQGASIAEQVAQVRAAMQGGLSDAMRGVGGERGAAPFRDQVRDAAALWRETWINAIRGTQGAFADFFDRVGAEGFDLLDIIKGIASSIRRALAEALAQQVVGSILSGLFKGATAGSGNLTQSGGGADFRAAPVSDRGQRILGAGAGGGIVVHQSIRFNVSALDGPSVDAMLRARGGTIAGIVGQAAADAPGLARFIVAQGTR